MAKDLNLGYKQVKREVNYYQKEIEKIEAKRERKRQEKEERKMARAGQVSQISRN